MVPLNYLKIDRSFVNRLEEDELDRNLVSTVIDLARKFELLTVAEGVETDAQLTILKELGASFAQGHLISNPLPADLFEGWLEKRTH